jgi:ankyrin repeat protein
VAEHLTSEEAKNLLHLCRAGRLYEVEKWIASGKSIQTSADVRKTPLHIAINSGFHSLVELLARHEGRQEAKNQALSFAVSEKQLDFVELLVAHGAQPRSIPLADVLLNWEPAMIRFFLENGADVITGAPFAVAFREKIRTALRPYVEYKKAHPELASGLQEQADRALRHFCNEGDLKWLSLLLWAGANPRSRGPDLDDRWADDPECHTTALKEACSKGNLDVLKKLKIDPHTDDLSELLRARH